MDAFKQLDGIVAPLDRPNIDTDAILPKQYMKSISRTGFGPYLFDELRYLDAGTLDTEPSTRRPNPSFCLNQARYQGSSILLTRDNFGCGSSREHAPWALYDYGFRSIIASSFADIFYGNCFKNGILPIRLPSELVDQLFNATLANEGFRLAIDLEHQICTTSAGDLIRFDLDETRRRALMFGLDEIDQTLQKEGLISAYESARFRSEPWIFKQP